jgi:hypothetical protein
MNSNFFIRCNYCASSEPIEMHYINYLVGQHLYSGVCTNKDCTQKQQFACKLCFDFANKELASVSSRGRPIGIYTQLTTAKKHSKTSVTHKEALLLNDTNVEEEYNNNDNDNNYETLNLNIPFNMNENDDIINIINKENNTLNSKSKGFNTKSNSIKYYENEHKEKGMGAKYLIGNAFELHEDSYKNITLQEVNYFMKLTLLLTQLTEVQQKLLAEILLLTSTSKDSKLNIFSETRVPTCVDDFNDIFLKKDNAIIPNLPHPVVNTTLDGSHAFVSLIDLLANEMADATSYDKLEFEKEYVNDGKTYNLEDKISTVSKSEAAEKLYWELQEPKDDNGIFTMYLWLKEWRDGFDPNTTKSSRNQVWINTFTISPPETDNGGKNTYLMSIAGKSENHSEIDKQYGEEIDILSKIGHEFYHGGRKEIIKVKLGKMITCVDRPERASMFKVGDHTGKYSRYWGFAGSVDGQCQFNNLPSCTSCRSNRLHINDTIYNDDNNMICENNNKCSNWNVSNFNFTFPVPGSYPTIYDTSIGAPLMPLGRKVISNKTGIKRRHNKDADKQNLIQKVEKQRLPMIEMSIEWLKSGIIFAHHNLKTSVDVNNSKSKKYWTKGNVSDYLKTFGISNSIINMVIEAATKNQPIPSYPETWWDNKAMEKCHYAGMHMLFLGHVKSNYMMLSKWLNNCSLSSVFGKQANKYFESIKKLRATKYFTAHNLSTSTWGTGNWVSENYLFFARTQKFFLTLSAIIKSKNILSKDNIDFCMNYRVILRFVSSSHASLSRIMSMKQNVPDMNKYIKIYMDCMVEMDTEILENVRSRNNLNGNDMDDSNSIVMENNNMLTTKKTKTKINKTTSKHANFVKSNSLGILSVAKSHNIFGPLILNWEGGFAGERKIQEVKPFLHIKRINADWEKISLTKYYQLQTINKILESTRQLISPTAKKSRETEGILKIYLNRTMAENAVLECEPLSAVLDREDRVYIGYRAADKTSRSALSLVEIIFDDSNGKEISGICWMSPITIGDNVIQMQSLNAVLKFSKEFCLLLPQLNDEGTSYINNYYAIGHTWSERHSNGKFELSTLNIPEIFHDWLPCCDNETSTTIL